MMKQPLTYIPEVLESHLDEIAFLYEQYLLELESSQSDPDYLHLLANRLRANISGVLLVSDVAWGEIEMALNDEEEVAFFTASIIAFGKGDVQRIKQVVDLAEGEASLSAVAFALVWLPWNVVHPWSEKFLQSKRPELIYLGVYAYLWHRKKTVLDVSTDYERIFTESSSSAVLSNVLKLIRITKDSAIVPQLRRLSEVQKTPLSGELFQILETRIVLGDLTAVESLKAFLMEINPNQEVATTLCFSQLDTDTAKRWLRELQAHPNNERLILIAIGALREKALLPWVVNQIQDIKLARLAGKVIGQILGIDIEEQGWVLDDESLDGAWLEIEGDEMLPWPNQHTIRAALGLD